MNKLMGVCSLPMTTSLKGSTSAPPPPLSSLIASVASSVVVVPPLSSPFSRSSLITGSSLSGSFGSPSVMCVYPT